MRFSVFVKSEYGAAWQLDTETDKRTVAFAAAADAVEAPRNNWDALVCDESGTIVLDHRNPFGRDAL